MMLGDGAGDLRWHQFLQCIDYAGRKVRIHFHLLVELKFLCKKIRTHCDYEEAQRRLEYKLRCKEEELVWAAENSQLLEEPAGCTAMVQPVEWIEKMHSRDLARVLSGVVVESAIRSGVLSMQNEFLIDASMSMEDEIAFYRRHLEQLQNQSLQLTRLLSKAEERINSSSDEHDASEKMSFEQTHEQERERAKYIAEIIALEKKCKLLHDGHQRDTQLMKQLTARLDWLTSNLPERPLTAPDYGNTGPLFANVQNASASSVEQPQSAGNIPQLNLDHIVDDDAQVEHLHNRPPAAKHTSQQASRNQEPTWMDGCPVLELDNFARPSHVHDSILTVSDALADGLIQLPDEVTGSSGGFIQLPDEITGSSGKWSYSLEQPHSSSVSRGPDEISLEQDITSSASLTLPSSGFIENVSSINVSSLKQDDNSVQASSSQPAQERTGPSARERNSVQRPVGLPLEEVFGNEGSPKASKMGRNNRKTLRQREQEMRELAEAQEEEDDQSSKSSETEQSILLRSQSGITLPPLRMSVLKKMRSMEKFKRSGTFTRQAELERALEDSLNPKVEENC